MPGWMLTNWYTTITELLKFRDLRAQKKNGGLNHPLKPYVEEIYMNKFSYFCLYINYESIYEWILSLSMKNKLKINGTCIITTPLFKFNSILTRMYTSRPCTRKIKYKIQYGIKTETALLIKISY